MIVYGHFEWDIREAAKNLAAHGVSFKEATTVFADETCTVLGDGGSPLQAIGVSQRGRRLVVLHQRGSRVRILGAELHVPEAKKAPPPPQVIAAVEPPAPEAKKAPPPPQVTAAVEPPAAAATAAAKKASPRPNPPTTGVRANSWRAAARAAGQQPVTDPEQRR